LVEPTKQFVLSFRKSGDRHAVNAGATPVLPDPLPGFLQIVWIVDFVDQRMDFPVPRLPFSSVGQRVPGILDNGAGSFEPRTYLRNSRDVGPRFHGMPVQDFRACRPGISRHVGPAFQSMSVQFVRQDNHGYRGSLSARGEIDGGPSEVVHAADSRDFTAPGRGV